MKVIEITESTQFKIIHKSFYELNQYGTLLRIPDIHNSIVPTDTLRVVEQLLSEGETGGELKMHGTRFIWKIQ